MSLNITFFDENILIDENNEKLLKLMNNKEFANDPSATSRILVFTDEEKKAREHFWNCAEQNIPFEYPWKKFRSEEK